MPLFDALCQLGSFSFSGSDATTINSNNAAESGLINLHKASRSPKPKKDDRKYFGSNNSRLMSVYKTKFDPKSDTMSYSFSSSPKRASPPSNYRQQNLSQMLSMINEERKHYKLKPLKLDTRLAKEAQSRSVDMTKRHYYSHLIPDKKHGHYVFDELNRKGYRYNTAGENIMTDDNINYGVPYSDQLALINQAFMYSPGHRSNILNPKFTKVGLGIYFDPKTGTEKYTEDFAG